MSNLTFRVRTGNKGKVVVLIDERAISQAEHTCLFLEAMTHAKFVGTPTTGQTGT
jgi:C-terminal processing protease CtpA/Prc